MISCKVTGHKAVIELAGPVTGAARIRSMSDQLSDACSGISGEGMRPGSLQLSDPGKARLGGEKGTTTFSKRRQQCPGLFRSPAESLGGLELPVIVGIQGDASWDPAWKWLWRATSGSPQKGPGSDRPKVSAGFIPCDGGTQRLSRIVGKAKALEMILTGEMIEAREALRIGLVNRVVPEAEVVKTVMAMAGEMVSRAPVAMRFAKEAVLNGMDMTLEQGLRMEADLYFLLHTTRDRTEGITAFREKKMPRFEGK